MFAPFLPPLLEFRALGEVRRQPLRKHRHTRLLADQSQKSRTNAAPRKRSDPKIVSHLRQKTLPFSPSPQVTRVRPHMKAHQVIATFSRKYNKEVRRNVTSGVKQTHEKGSVS